MSTRTKAKVELYNGEPAIMINETPYPPYAYNYSDLRSRVPKEIR